MGQELTVSKTKGLKPQQLRFAELVADGLTQFAAYQEAYPTSLKWKEQSVRTNAHKLAKRPEVLAKIEELRTYKATYLTQVRYKSQGAIVDLFQEGIEQAKESGDYVTLINAADKLGRFLGLNGAPEDFGDREELDDLTDAELVELVRSQQNAEKSSGRTSEKKASA